MSGGLTGNVQSLKDFSATLRGLPTTVAIKVAAAAAPALTAAARATFDAGEDAYGNAWKPGVDGQRITLKKSGGLASGVYYVATGTKLRIKFAANYAKYQLGKRPVFPTQGSPLPTAYVKALQDSTAAVIRAELAS